MTTDSGGRLIALEGIDGCGKSTQAARLAARLGAALTFEPGATALGSALRALLLDPSAPHPGLRAEALLMVADRAQHLEEVVEPWLAEGRWVVTDRFSGSTLAYQGWGRGIDVASLRQLIDWATGGRSADLSVLVDVPPDVARRRMTSGGRDRLEGLDPAFHVRVREGFLTLAAADPDHWAVVDGDASEDTVADRVLGAVTSRLGHPGDR